MGEGKKKKRRKERRKKDQRGEREDCEERVVKREFFLELAECSSETLAGYEPAVLHTQVLYQRKLSKKSVF